ncbi:MAG: MFS transporter [Candidatus Absconditabacterales bacterium]
MQIMLQEKKIQRKNLLCRVIYDFGNSFFIVAIGAMFLAQRLIIDNKVPDIRYGASFSLATILVLFVSPFLGARSDKIGRRMPFLTRSTIALITINGMIALAALSSFPNKVRIVLGLSVILQFFYQISLIFYNALLKDISKETNRGTIAGIGDGLGNLGWIVALFIFLPIANGTFALIGTAGRHQVFLPAFILSTLFMLPMLLRFKEHKQPIIHATQNIYKKTRTGIRQLRTTQKNVGLYLLAFSLISDIVLTMTLYLAVVMDTMYKVGETTKSTVLIIFLIMGMFFGYIFGKFADKFGYKNILILTCVLLTINCIIFFSCTTPWVLYVVGALGGIASGGYFTVTRAFMIRLSPLGEIGEYFGLYSTFQKAASITAPLLRGGITLWLIQYPVFKYQVAGAAMTILLIVGTILMMRVKEH